MVLKEGYYDTKGEDIIANEEFLNKVLHGDCLEWLTKLEDKSIDLIICDPPYYKTYGEFDFIFKNEEEYLDWCKKWAKECYRVLKDDGAFYCWGTQKND